MRTITACFASRQENFLLLRFMAASMVIFGHCWAIGLNPTGETDWLGQRTLLFSGTLAVHMFFFISGFLVTMSYERRHSFLAFVRARTLRIFPALMICVALTALVLGPLISEMTVEAYFLDPQWSRYLIGNISLQNLQWRLPGVFVHNHNPHTVNGSLYTIPGEIQMYLYVAGLGILGLLRSRFRFGAAILVLLAMSFFLRDQVTLLTQPEFYIFGAFFVAGAFCWMHRDRIIVSGYVLLILLLACAVVYRQPGYFLLLGAATAYGCLWFVYLPGLQWFNRFGDYSYGLYLYGFVIQQTVAKWFPQFGPLPLFMASFPLALGLAIASWHLIEKPALRFK